MTTRGGGGGGQGIPAASRKMVQSLKEIVNGVSDTEIYNALKDCNMDPNEAVNRLLTQDPFHEVKSKREKKKELKDTTETKPRGGGSTSNRGARSGADRYSGRGGSSQFSSSETGGVHGKSKRENGTSSYTSSYTSSSASTYGHATTNTNLSPPSFSGSAGYENKPSTFSAPDVTASIPQQPSSGYQSAWLGAPGQKSMADIVKMGRPQPKVYSNPVSSQQQFFGDYAYKAPEVHQEHNVSPDDDWPVFDQPPQTVGVQSFLKPHIDSENAGQSNVTYETSNQYLGSHTDETQVEDENVYEDHPANHVLSGNLQDDTAGSAPLYDNEMYNMDSFDHKGQAFEHNEVKEGDAPASSLSANMQQLNIQEEIHLDEPEEEVVPSVLIPNHLQAQIADCSHLSFGSFGATMKSGSFPSRQLRNKIEDTHIPVEADNSSVGPSETRNSEYYNDESIITSESNLVHRMGPSPGSYELPSASQTEVLKQENAEVAHENQYNFSSSTHGPGYTFDSTQLSNHSFPQSQTPTQMPNTTPFSNVVAAYTNALPNTMLAANGHPVKESDLSYSPFPINQSTSTKYGSSTSSIGGSTISMAEALKTGAFSSSQPTQQTPPGSTIPTGPALSQHLAVHPYSQHSLPLGPFANMVGYPFVPQSYTYMPSGFQQQAFAGNSTYHQQLAAVLPQYKNSVSVSSLPQSVPSGYGSFGNSTAMPGNFQANQPAGPAGSTLSYDDVLNTHYKDNSQLLSLQQQQQQQNENPAMWVHGGGSRTMPAVPASTYYSFQGQSQQPNGLRHGQQLQQPSQSYGGATFNYPNYYHSQAGISQEYQLQQNPRNMSLVGGSQGQPKPQPQQQSQQQLWQNNY